jgi:hypothetical protein
MKRRDVMTKKTHLLRGALLAFVATGTVDAYARDNEVRQRGPIAQLSSTSVTVAGLTCPITAGTEFENRAGARISLSEFAVGDYVKLVCRDGEAHSLELEDEGSGSGGSDDDGAADDGDSSNSGGSDDKGGDDSSRGGSDDDTRLSSRLLPMSGSGSGAVGKVNYRNKVNGSNRDDRFKITVKIPVPSEVPAVVGFDDGASLNLSALLLRNGVPYAECTLEYDHRSFIKGVPAVEYKAEVRFKLKKSRFRARFAKGMCDTDLATDGVQRGFPVVQSGDEVVVSDSAAGAFLSVGL